MNLKCSALSHTPTTINGLAMNKNDSKGREVMGEGRRLLLEVDGLGLLPIRMTPYLRIYPCISHKQTSFCLCVCVWIFHSRNSNNLYSSTFSFRSSFSSYCQTSGFLFSVIYFSCPYSDYSPIFISLSSPQSSNIHTALYRTIPHQQRTYINAFPFSERNEMKLIFSANYRKLGKAVFWHGIYITPKK